MKFELEVRRFGEAAPIKVTVGLADFGRWCERTGNSSYGSLLSNVFDLGWAYVAWAGLQRTGSVSADYESWESEVESVTLVNPGKAPSRTRSTSKSRT